MSKRRNIDHKDCRQLYWLVRIIIILVIIIIKIIFRKPVIVPGRVYLQFRNGIHKEKLKKLGLFTGTKDNCTDLIAASIIKAEMIAGRIISTIRKEN